MVGFDLDNFVWQFSFFVFSLEKESDVRDLKAVGMNRLLAREYEQSV